MDLSVFIAKCASYLTKISYWAIPVLFAITLREVAHGWTARYFGDRTGESLGRLSLNPLRHIDLIGTLLVPGLLLACGAPLFGWARPIPVEAGALRRARLAVILIALAGPAANLLMAAFWCAVLGGIVRVNGGETLNSWIALMAQAGILINVMLALFHLLPIPPLDGGRVFEAVLPPRLAAGLDGVAPLGFLIALNLSLQRASGWPLTVGWVFDPTYRAVGRVITVLVGPVA